MNSLLIDSSNTNLTVGIMVDSKVIYEKSFYAWQRQSEMMIPELDEALKKTKLELLDFDEVVTGIGPGSYTGVRIALTIAKTMCTLNPKCHLKVVSSLRIEGTRDEKYIALMNARSSRSYIGIYNNGLVELNDSIMTNEEVKKIIPEYIEKGYVLRGDLEYLGYESKQELVQGLASYSPYLEEYKDVLKVKPVYLKD